MEVSVIIPTHRRPARLAACLQGLAAQSLDPSRYEVLVGLDGPDPESESAARNAWGLSRARLHIQTCQRQGYNGVRNEILKAARGRILLSLNDDVLPSPTLIETHLASHDKPAIITGYSPFIDFPDPTLFDTLARSTSMIFFYDQMTGDKSRPLDHDWGFRHCWGLNFSAPLGAIREVGAFTAFPMCYGYDDIEIAHRLRKRFGLPVLFRPEALAAHDHRYTPRDVLDREHKLGGTAWRFAAVNPDFCREVFGRDIRSPEELAYSREFVQRERATAERLERSFLSLSDIPAGSVTGPDSTRLITLIYEQHLLLKRWHWRKGLLAASS